MANLFAYVIGAALDSTMEVIIQDLVEHVNVNTNTKGKKAANDLRIPFKDTLMVC